MTMTMTMRMQMRKKMRWRNENENENENENCEGYSVQGANGLPPPFERIIGQRGQIDLPPPS